MRAYEFLQNFSFLASLPGITSMHLNVTAVGGKDGKSRFECWQLSTPLDQSGQFGLVGTAASFLGDVGNMTYGVIPAGYEGEFHTAPIVQWIIVLNGMSRIVLADNSTFTVSNDGGESSFLFFADTPAVSRQGHKNYYPGDTETIFLQIPTRDGKIPEHRVLLDDAPCTSAEFVGLRSLASASCSDQSF
ncbi:hypothetical protein F4777DRAFT_478608 [Nemania sp. FL0916]|nr:hypothetical protein F4777DRAFT_478608 [Nemania sp. FL0916]